MKLLCIITGVAIFTLGQEVNIYLNSEAKASSNLSLQDIAKIESNEKINFSEIIIPKQMYDDGYIDADEVRDLIRTLWEGSFVRVFGHAVKIKFDNEDITKIGDERNKIKNGDKVEVVFRNKGIEVRTFGTALSDGVKGNNVWIKTSQSKRVRGKIVGEGMVEVIP